MQSALVARSGASSFAAQRRVARPRAVAARAQIKAPQVNNFPRSRERHFLVLLFFCRRQTSSSSSSRVPGGLFPCCIALPRARTALARRDLKSHAERMTRIAPESAGLERAISPCRQRRSARRFFFTHTHVSSSPPDTVTHTTRQNVTQPPVEPKLVTAKYGFVDNAERINSRAAMVSSLVFSSTPLRSAFFLLLARSLARSRPPPPPPPPKKINLNKNTRWASSASCSSSSWPARASSRSSGSPSATASGSPSRRKRKKETGSPREEEKRPRNPTFVLKKSTQHCRFFFLHPSPSLPLSNVKQRKKMKKNKIKKNAKEWRIRNRTREEERRA